MEPLEDRRLLASDVFIGLTDSPSSYMRTLVGSDVAYTPLTDNAQIGDFRLDADVNAGLNVTINTVNAASAQDGDIVFGGSVVLLAANDASLSLEADDDVLLTDAQIESMTNPLTIVLNSDRDESGSGRVDVDANSLVHSKGGTITIGGGAFPLVTAAFGNVSNAAGVTIQGDLTTEGGGISIRGEGFSGPGTAGAHGVDIRNGGSIASAAGSITVHGAGGNTSEIESHGVNLGDDSLIQSTSGDIDVTGIENASRFRSAGVAAVSDSTANASFASISTDDGSISVTGTGSSFGVIVSGGAQDNRIESTGSGNITIEAKSIFSVSSTSPRIEISGIVGGINASGDIAIITDRLALNETGVGFVQSTGTLTIQPQLSSTSINLGVSTSGFDGIRISAQGLASLRDGFSGITIGNISSGSGDVVLENVEFTDPLTIVGGSVTTFGRIAGDGGLTLTAIDNATSGQDVSINSGTITDASASIMINAGDDVRIGATAVLTTPVLVSPLTINLDLADEDPFVGSSITIEGTIPPSGTTINGGTDTDSLATLPGVESTITINDVENFAQISLFVIESDDLAPGTSGDGFQDEFVIINDLADVRVSINGSSVFQAPSATTDSLVICGSSDADLLLVDHSKGLIEQTILFDDACPFLTRTLVQSVPRDTFDVVQVTGTTSTTTNYRSGLSAGAGSVTQENLSIIQDIEFFGVRDLQIAGVGAGDTLSVRGRSSSQSELYDDMEYREGLNSNDSFDPFFAGDLTGEVRNFTTTSPTLEFSRFGVLELVASSEESSSDFMLIDNPIIPTNLSVINVVDPVGSFGFVQISGTAGADAIVIDQDSDVTSVVGLQPLPISVHDFLQFDVDGVAGDDSLTFTGESNPSAPFIFGSDTLTVDGFLGDNSFSVSQSFSSFLNLNGYTASISSGVGELILNGTDGDDSLSFSVSSSGSSSPTAVTFNGGLHAVVGDQVTLSGTTTLQTFNYAASGATGNNGSVQMDNALLNYSGLEPITSTVTADNVTLNYSGAAETIAVTQPVAGSTTVDSTIGEITTFANPTVNLTINTGGGTDIINVDGLNLANSDLMISDPDLDDTLNFETAPTDIGTGALDATVLNANINQPLTAGSLVINSSVGTTTINTPTITTTAGQGYGNSVVLAADLVATGVGVSFSTVDGGFNLTVNDSSANVGFSGFFGNVGEATPLASLTTDAAGATSIGSSPGTTVVTTGDQVYGDAVVFGPGGTSHTITSLGGAISFAGSIDGVGAGDSVAINSAGVASFGGAIGAMSLAGTGPIAGLTVNTAGPFVLGQNVTTTSDFVVDVTDTAAVTDDLTINNAAVISSTDGAVFLNVGDDVDIQSGVAISLPSGLLQVVADSSPVDPDSVGSSIFVNATIATSSGLFLGGGQDADTFLVSSQAGSVIDITANDPPSVPGDILTIDAGGLDATIDVVTGTLAIPGTQPITDTGIEARALTNVGTLTINGDVNSSDDFTIASDPNVIGGDSLWINGGIVSLSSIGRLVVNGLGGDDYLTYDATAGMPTTPVTFHGGQDDMTRGGDQLAILGTFPTQTINYTAPSVDGKDGTVDLNGTVLTYTGLEPILAGDSTDTILTFNTGLANNATLKDSVSAGFIEIIDNGSTFEDTIIPNPTNSLTINLGALGDTLQVNTLDAAYAASMIINGGTAATDNVQLTNVDLINTPGRGLLVTETETLGITGGTISGNTALIGGGILMANSTSGTQTAATISGTTISGNTASGDAIDDGGGGIFNNGGTLSITGAATAISNNVANGIDGRGGGIFNSTGGTLTITDATIDANTANGGGGGIEDASGAGFGVTLTGGSLINNVTGASFNGDGGGGLLVTGDSDVLIDGTLIQGNTTALSGGGLFNGSGTMTIQGGAIIENNVASGDGNDDGGGGIQNDGGTLIISGANTTIRNNQASGLLGTGGGIYSTGDGSVSITDATVTGNTATNDGGGLFADGNGGSVNLSGATFNANVTGDAGGGALIDGPTTTIASSIFTGNQAQGGGLLDGNGGGLFLGGDTATGGFTISDTKFDMNTALGGGGGLFILNVDGTISGGTFNSNQVTGNGLTFDTGSGGLLVVGETRVNTVGITGITVDGNNAPAAAGIGIVDSLVAIASSSITGNTATEAASGGGGIGAIANAPLGGNILTMTSSTVTGNTTAGEGGGVGVINADFSITDTTITNNQANGGRGGGIGLLNVGIAGTATVRSTTITANTAAAEGGGIAVLNSGLDLENVTISGNDAGSTGGGIANDNSDDSVTSSISFSTITSNTSLAAGSNIAALGFPIDVAGSIFNDGDSSGSLNSSGGNLDSGNTSGFNQSTDLPNTDPLLGPLQNNGGPVFTHAPLASSPAIDAGPLSGPATDARGLARPLDGDGNGSLLFDIGAVEFKQAVALVVDEVSDIVDGDITPGNLSLREAIIEANALPDADSITFDAVVFATALTITLSGTQLDITHDVTITGPGDALLTISGNSVSQIFVISGATTDVTLSGMTLTNGNGQFGKAIQNIDANLTVTDSTITGNTAVFGGGTFEQGGGIFNGSGTLAVVNSTISGNRATSGGGIYNNTGTLTISNSTIAGNNATYGGGVLSSGSATVSGSMISDNSSSEGSGLNNQGTMTVTGSTISGNVGSEGGGIENSGTMTITDSTISGNTASDYGGGILNSDTVTVTRTIIDGNVSYGDGGGISNYIGSTTVTDSTISNNTASTYGGGIRNLSGSLTVTGSTISGNSAAADGGGIESQGYSQLSIINSTISGNTSSGGGGGVKIGGPDGTDTAIILNTTISGNLSDGLGGGIAVATSANLGVVLSNTIVAGNISTTLAGPSDIEAGGSSGGALDLANSVSNLIGDPSTSGGIVDGNLGNIVGDGSGGVIPIDSILDTTLRDYGGFALTHALVAGSPALEAADASVAPAFDQRGIGRPIDADSDGTALPDIGAYESLYDTRSYVLDEDTVLQVLDTDGGLTLTTNDDGILAGVTANFGIEISAADVGLRTLMAVTGEVVGDLDLASDGSFTFVPAADFNGLAFFSAQVNGFTTVPPSTFDITPQPISVTLNVTPVNDPPIAQSDSVVATEEATTRIEASLLLANDIGGPANEVNQILLIDSVTNLPATDGTAVLNGDGSVSFTPSVGFIGQTSFEYTIVDVPGSGIALTSLPATVFVTVDGSGTIQGTKFNDLNADGDDESGADPRLSGVTIVVSGDSDRDGTFDTRIDVTDAGGVYQLTGLASGNYLVNEAPLTINSFTVRGSNTPVDVDEPAVFDGVADSVGGGLLIVNERVDVISTNEQWVEVSFDAAQGGLAGNIDNDWFANFDIQTDKTFSIPESFIYFRSGSTPLLLSSFATQQHPFDNAVGTINTLGDTRGPSNNEALGIFSNPFSSLLNSNGVDPTQVTGLTLGYRLVLDDTPRSPTTPIPVSVLLAAGQTATDAANATGQMGELIISDLLIGNAVAVPTLTVDDVTVEESVGTATLTVTLDIAVLGGFTVDYSSLDSTAIEPGDYTAAQGMLTFTGTAGETQMFSVPIIDDLIVEPTESFNITLSNPSNVFVDETDTAVVNITDNDTAILSVDDVTVNESAGTATVTVSLNGEVAGGFTVDYATADGTAIEPGDYTATPGTLTFAGTAGETQVFTVPIIDDLIVEPTESFGITLSNPSNTAVDATDTAVVNITDNNTATLSVDDVAVNESAGTATVTVSLNAEVAGGFIVDYATADGTAIEPGDYTAALGTLTFGGTAGETQAFTVPIIDDLIVEPAESLLISLSNPSNTAVDASDTAVVNITDNDTAVLTLGDVSVDEGIGNAIVTVSLSNPVQGGFTVDYATMDGSAIDGVDYIATAGTLMFLGQVGETRSLSVEILDDVDFGEPDIDFSVAISTIHPSIDASDAAAITIRDDDTPNATIEGHVSCDANGNDIEDTGEALAGATVFIDLDGDRVFDTGEPNTLTDSLGDFAFSGLSSGATTVALVVPGGCFGVPFQFAAVESSVTVSGLAREIAAADYYGDPGQDLLIVSDQSNELTILRNVGGSFSERETISLPDRPQAIDVWQPTQGSAVIAVASVGIATTADLVNNVLPIVGGVTVIEGQQTRQLQMGNGPIDVAIDDFDEDGKADFVSAAYRSFDFHLLLSEESKSVVLDTSNVPIGVATGDFNNDGHRDIVLADHGPLQIPVPPSKISGQIRLAGSVQILFGDGTGKFPQRIEQTSFAALAFVGSGDFATSGSQATEGDELVVLGFGGQVAVFAVSENGFEQVGSAQLAGGPKKLAIGDVNRDGELDIAVVNSGDATIDVLLSNETGAIIAAKTAKEATNPVAVTFGDFDGDMIEDFAVAELYTDDIKLPGSSTLLRLNVDELVVDVTPNIVVRADFSPSNDLGRLDTNGDGNVSALDALRVINVLSRQWLVEGEQIFVSKRTATDVNGDGRTSAVDALMIINHLHREADAEGSQVIIDDLIVDDDEDNRDELVAAIDLAFAQSFEDS